MFKRTPLALLALIPLLVTAGCTNDTLDDGDSADVIMEVLVLSNPPVSAALDTMTGACTFTITDWSFDVAAEPKNALADPPYNDIELISVSIVYDWLNDALDAGQVNPRIVGLGGTTVPAGASAQVAFQPIAFDDLTLGHSGSTANLTMTFVGRTVEGTTITKVVLRQLNIESCA